MNAISTVKARNEFSTLVNRAAFGKERLLLTRRGKAVVAIVPIEDIELLEELEDRLDLEDARRALLQAKKEKPMAWDKVKKKLGL